uniref:Uncharacterized protein n=1 Tax=Lepeophtheirus salmonis TaxID=72036 RepID=A0A0K2US23_LEPSM
MYAFLLLKITVLVDGRRRKSYLAGIITLHFQIYSLGLRSKVSKKLSTLLLNVLRVL